MSLIMDVALCEDITVRRDGRFSTFTLAVLSDCQWHLAGQRQVPHAQCRNLFLISVFWNLCPCHLRSPLERQKLRPSFMLRSDSTVNLALSS